VLLANDAAFFYATSFSPRPLLANVPVRIGICENEKSRKGGRFVK
jgi:hypothetical protein